MSRRSFLVGFLGDLTLQFINTYTSKGKDWGLDTYFDKHGVIESLFIASGMTVGADLLHDLLFTEKTFASLVFIGFSLDIAFRYFMPMPSLRDYYSKLNFYETIFWAVVPALLL